MYKRQEHVWIDTVDLAMMATHGSGAYDSFWNRDLSSVYYSTCLLYTSRCV